ncbi:hypothetical protein MHU86_14916 [Fragilaria crotonensis]|nr:hypothetical protein MHU86_14916 [Fragilaria crotonensis]
MRRTKVRTPIRSTIHVGNHSKASLKAGKGLNLALLVSSMTLLMLLLLSVVFYWTVSISEPTIAAPGEHAASISQLSPPRRRKEASFQQASTRIAQFRKDFVEKYGATAIDWYHKAITPFGSLDTTARRLLTAENKFVMAFAGYSVTVGRGNHFSQSFPFVLERLFRPVLRDILSVDLEVRNAAIGGIPSFPYAFCLPHFLGEDADVISWDYSMNEGNGAAVLESYIRLSQKSLSRKRPMMIVLDKNPQRKKLLQDYARMGILLDGVSISRAGEVIPKELLEEKDESMLPVGLHNWNDFGAPHGCPGMSSWHPKRAEHEFLGHLLAMHFVDALERAVELSAGTVAIPHMDAPVALPKPLMTPADNAEAVTRLLYGHAQDDVYQLKDLSCRTSFLPAQDHEKVLPSIVVDGLAPNNPDIMEERSDALYATGWVLDVSKIERDTKKKVERCGGLGYIDMKIALYGIRESGTLRLWLPYEGKMNTGQDDAEAYFDSLILCEANEKRDDKACRLDRDLTLTVGGTSSVGSMVNGVGVYLNRQTCLHVQIPRSACNTVEGFDESKW